MTENQHAGEQAPRSCSAREPADGQRCRVRVGSPDGVLAVVPHLLGFHPSSSIVVLGIAGPRARIHLAFRYDLPEPPDPALSGDIAAHAVAVLQRQHLAAAIVIGYGPGSLVTPVADLLGPALRGSGLTVRDMLRVEAGRYWSYLCRDPRCCPADGVRFDVLAHPAAAALSGAGLTVQPDRASLARTLAPAPGVIAAMGQATERALARAQDLARQAMALPGGEDAARLVIDAGRLAVREAVAAYRGGGEVTDHDQIAWLTVTLADLRVRDDAWARMDPDFRLAHRRLWTDVVRHAQAGYLPAPACLLAFTAWQSGEGALASMAIERALAADPGYSMALLLAEAIRAGLPPSAARLPMTPEQVAESYAGTERRRGAAAPALPAVPASRSRPAARRARSRPS
jgi:hypothetical protein